MLELRLELRLQYFHHLKWWANSKDSDAGKDWRQEEQGTTEDEMVGWYHLFNGHELEQAPGVGDAIQSTNPLLSPSPASRSQHQGLLQWVGPSSSSASVLPMNIQDWFPLGLTGLISLESKELSWVFSNTTVQNHQFFSSYPSLQSNSYIHTWLLEKP